MKSNPKAQELIEQGFEYIIRGIGELGYQPDSDPNFAGTAGRAARAMSDLIADREDARAEIAELLTHTFPAEYREMVISKYNVAFGMCPHHLLPVIYRVSLAYIPTDKVLGISKLSRLVRLASRAPTLQETLTHDLCDMLYNQLASEGAAVYIEGLHMCMAARGVSSHEARVVTSAVRGVFLDNPATRNEFIKLVTASHPTLI